VSEQLPFFGIFDGGFRQIFEGAIYRQLFVVYQTILYETTFFAPFAFLHIGQRSTANGKGLNWRVLVCPSLGWH
jgi:hypothetical protein